jgi:hypothetical protein
LLAEEIDREIGRGGKKEEFFNALGSINQTIWSPPEMLLLVLLEGG